MDLDNLGFEDVSIADRDDAGTAITTINDVINQVVLQLLG